MLHRWFRQSFRHGRPEVAPTEASRSARRKRAVVSSPPIWKRWPHFGHSLRRSAIVGHSGRKAREPSSSILRKGRNRLTEGPLFWYILLV